ncbi:hypothetical protein H1C71_004239 [Ictidomys tridecemlineatus]|nr:hypothetical protein H1C71_004239 [Ictidomys tridecemlineatus]KAG3277512.1 hypothetical protein H1C71_004239 [Ictidomys tridecemlineatus]
MCVFENFVVDAKGISLWMSRLESASEGPPEDQTGKAPFLTSRSPSKQPCEGSGKPVQAGSQRSSWRASGPLSGYAVQDWREVTQGVCESAALSDQCPGFCSCSADKQDQKSHILNSSVPRRQAADGSPVNLAWEPT